MRTPDALGDEALIFLLFLILFSFFLVPSAVSREVLSLSRDLHWAVTEEKFELALERLRWGKKARRRVPVVLIHGLLVNSSIWNLDEDYSLARYLAQEGFDVWSLSLRGTGRSLEPLRGGPKRWTLDDMMDRDIPSVIRYVRKESRSPKISWVGFEIGGLLLYGHLERKGDSGLAGLVTIGAPVTFSHSAQEPIKGLLKLAESPTLKRIFLYLNTRILGRLFIPLSPKIEGLFYNRENIEDEVQERLLEDAFIDINPGVLDHVLLTIQRGEFVSAKGDLSYRKNLAKIRLPLLLIGGEKDMLAPPEAIQAVHRAVGSEDRALRVFGPRSKDGAAYGHLDLLVGRKARQEVFPVIGRWLEERDRLE